LARAYADAGYFARNVRTIEVLVDEPGVGRSHREAPEIDGVVGLPHSVPVGTLARVKVTGAAGPDLEATWPAGETGR